MNDTRLGRKEKSQHIQVFVRVRPLSENESNTKSTNIIEIPNDEELIVHECPYDKFSKKFKFNSVFGPCSKQIDVYTAVVSPLLDQVLAGYNCTIFAYGQTGTGKTFTMEGINNDHTLSHWRNDSPAGMIPRSLSHIFDKLQSLEAQEYTIRVSFLELYNEDLFDLLSPNDDGTKIKLYEDASKKGTIITHGLEEVTVHTKTEVYKILEKGSERRQTAATLMNAHSSRSHTVFSITVHMKENTVEGEEVLKTGKLNLVDLAGSESIARSGSVDRRAREAGSINQSLLTLGRVITALVERAPHIPYRESKLTRLLQESLGGRTKTSIIATISPANINLEETLSTLDYAHRAKNITNRPEINQKVSKKEFLKQYTEEIERLRRDLLATRERNGVYLANENYNEMQTLITQQSKEIEEKINRIKALEKNMQDKEKIYNDLELQNIAQMKELDDTKIKLNSAADALNSTNYQLKLTTQERDEQKFLVEKHMNTEQTLLSQAQALLNVADTATDDSHKLHDKIARKTATEQTFEELGERFKNNITDTVQGIKKDVSLYGEELMQFCLSQKNDLVKEIFHQCENIDTAVKQVAIVLPNQHLSDANNLSDAINKSYSNYEDWMENETKNTVTTLESEHELLSAASSQLAQDIDNIIENEFAKYLQTIQNGVTAKFQEAAIFMKDKIDCMCNSELENYNRLNKHLMDIERNVETLCEKQQFTEKQRSFTKMLGATFAHWDDLNKKQEEDFSAIMNKCNRVSDLCSELKRQTTDSCNGNIKTLNDLKDRVRRDMEKIENKVTLRTKENEEVANRITEDGKELIKELKTNVNESYDATKHHKNAVECSVKEMQVQMVADKTKASSLIEDARQVVLDACKNHAEFVEDKKTEVSNTFEELSEKLDKQMLESSNWSDDVSVQLEATKRGIHKFFEDDIQRDTATGSTPAKKEFSYPRQFKATSPHDRILQRFRETRKLVETSQDYDETNISEITLREIANSTAISDVFASPPSDATIIEAALSNCSAISRIETTTRTLDFASTTVQYHDRSELTASKKE